MAEAPFKDITMKLAISGKGGVGKSTLAGALALLMAERSKRVLAVDADPDTNLPETLGCETSRTVGDIKEFMQEERDKLPPDSNKESILKSKLYEILEEMPGYDLVVMGRPEGSGCYCYINNLLRGIMDKLVDNYDVLIIDTEAGLEHFSRKIFRNVDELVVVTDGSRRGLRTAERIRDLVGELETDVSSISVIANKVTDANRVVIAETAKELGLELIGMIPADEMIAERDLAGEPLFDLPDESVAVQEIEKIAEKLGL